MTMRRRVLFSKSIHFAFIPVLFLFGCCNPSSYQENEEYFNMSGPYLGQPAPGTTPTLFCPEVFNTEVHSTAMFSPDGQEVYWKEMGGRQSLYMSMSDDRWSVPKKVDFALPRGTGDPALSPDGNSLFFTSFQSPQGFVSTNKENIWFVTRTGNGWSEPLSLGPEVNQYEMHWQHSIAANGNLYFSAENGQGDKDIYVSEFIDSGYAEPVVLGNTVNGPNSEGCPYISPAEGYLIFDRHGGTIGHADLFISFRNSDGSWSKALDMGNVINTNGNNETCPFVTFDQKYFFFIRNDQSGALRIYWVDAGVIEALRPGT